MTLPAASELRASQGRLADLAGSIFSLMVVLQKAANLDSFVELRRKMTRLFAEFQARALEQRIPQEEIDAACCALSGTIEERLLLANWAGKDDFNRNRFAKAYWGDEHLYIGEKFFERLEQLRRGSTPRTNVIEVFYYCLVLGFKGRFLLNKDQRERTELMKDLARDICSVEPNLSPPAPQDHGFLEPIPGVPWPLILVGCVSLAVLAYFVTSFILYRRVEGFSQELQKLIQSGI